MPYGHHNPEQEGIIREVVAGKSVIDIGCGDMTYSERLRQMGARSVLALDKCDLPTFVPGIEIVQTSIDKFEQKNRDRSFDVGFLSWPVNRDIQGLSGLLRRCGVVIYLGSNVDGSACGNHTLFFQLMQRRLDHYSPDRSNSLIVVSEPLSEARPPTGEEYAAIHSEKVFSFKEAHAKADSLRTLPGVGVVEEHHVRTRSP